MNLFNWKQYQALVFLTYSIAFSITGYAQMNHPSHVNVGGSVKEKVSCETSGLECANAANPYFSQDGKLHLVWSANGIVSYAQSIDLGKSWSSSIEIASHGKALDTGSDARPQIVVNKQGLIFIAYSFFRDKNWNAQVNYAYSLDGGKSFTTPKSIVNDASSQRFPSLLLEPDGTLFLSWIDKRLVQAAKAKGGKALGASLAFAKSNDFGKTFSTDKIANEQMCECCRIGATLNTNKAQNNVILYIKFGKHFSPSSYLSFLSPPPPPYPLLPYIPTPAYELFEYVSCARLFVLDSLLP